MKEELKQRPKYELLMEFLPTFDNRPWLQSMSRGARIAVSRMLLSQHRLPIGKGRWKNIPREERYCPHCGSSEGSERKIGDEKHYIMDCPLTKKIWTERSKKIGQKYRISREKV